MAFLKTGDGGKNAVSFQLSSPSGGSTNFTGYGIYNPNDKTVRIYASGWGNNVTTNIVAEGIPSQYRPTSGKKLVGLWSAIDSNQMTPVNFYVNSNNGTVYQDNAGSYSKFIVVGEYTL